MKEKYCQKFFYPEVYSGYSCCADMIESNGRCKRNTICTRKLNLTLEEYVTLDNLRIVKAQNAKILELLQKQK